MYNAPMFIGHFAVGFASKRFAPRTSFALLLAAPLLSDILWPVLLLLGWEHARIEPGKTKYSPLELYDVSWSPSLVLCSVALPARRYCHLDRRSQPLGSRLDIPWPGHAALPWQREIRPRPVELHLGNNGSRNRDVRDRRRTVC